eukprot:TRINITY_DN1245_c0_g1_i1.p1 TRINITY_DN1245_c0_g1~~TRINITY_DN1245_c0_g1_i1.p1  ORF type:complete len:322 (-),score=129.87 TRINITY_DN1245_c0_g1_i1:26-991(-)
MSIAEQFEEFTSKPYAEQAKCFLNAYWAEHEDSAEQIWGWVHEFIELDFENGKEGNDLDEFNAHRFLERTGETKTVKELREDLAKIDMDFNRRMAVVEYLLFRWKHTVEDFVNRPQGGGGESDELVEAQRLLDEVARALEECTRTADQAKQREDEAVAAEERAVEAEKPFRIAQEELEAALAELHQQEEEYENRKNDLTKRSEEGGVVSRNKAKNELAQLLGTDPLPLRQAKLTTEAANRKADKARAPFKAAREEAEAARADAVSAREEADAAVDDANAKYEEAEAYLQEVLSRPQEAYGSIWWMERELEEAKKYMPSKRR